MQARRVRHAKLRTALRYDDDHDDLPIRPASAVRASLSDLGCGLCRIAAYRTPPSSRSPAAVLSHVTVTWSPGHQSLIAERSQAVFRTS
ncbi:unnamed protein product [Soboliphyme baturini]|uniref:Uncharacterized protein n=1 Tax=Soboliphyme baturini TaxID=241478 RepID=A0A183IIB1_9BILA|nr:unnamed protein product [Soboliphyme baturini]